MLFSLLASRKSRHRLPPDVFLYQEPERLLSRHRGLLQEIRRMAGLPKAHFEALYTPLLRSYADYCQELPASEAHHHCGPGGALLHGLEVTVYALKQRRKMLLPVGATAEELAARQDLWTYAVTSAALFHDFGKPVTDLLVEMLDQNGAYLGTWQPWRSSMQEQGCKAYRMRYNRDRRHGLHERIPAFFAMRLFPPAGLEWLASDPEVFSQWSATLIGNWEQAGSIGEIVQLADSRSVAENLAGDQKQAPGARQKPLHERLMTGLRYLLDQGELPLNARGAAGWRDQDSLWLVSKRTLDALREHLEQEGQGGIPTRNDRLMDALQQAGCLLANGDKAIWKAKVMADDWPKATELTMLRFPVNRLWPDPTAAPPPFSGRVLVEGQVIEEGEPVIDEMPAETVSGPGEAPMDLPPSPSDGEQPDSLSEEALFDDDRSSTPAEEPSPRNDPGNPPDEETAAPPLQESGQRFLSWLRDNLHRDLLEVNSPSSRIHRVPEGLLLVSPGIFKDYRDPHPDASWQQVQRRFSRMKLHEKCNDGTNIHAYDVIGAKSRKRSVVKGYLLADLDAIFPDCTFPPPNPHLRRHGMTTDKGSDSEVGYSDSTSREEQDRGGSQ